jgi:hypothetical protein
MVAADAVWFSTTSRRLADEARHGGLPVVPGFRSPPRQDGATRTIRRLPEQHAIVAVAVRGRSRVEVLRDLVEGVVVANRLIGPDADRWRARLAAAAVDGDPDLGAAAA